MIVPGYTNDKFRGPTEAVRDTLSVDDEMTEGFLGSSARSIIVRLCR
jgi:hypothetical protein